MSYHCENCHKTIRAGVRSYRMVIQTRGKVYPFRAEANPNGTDDPGGNGTEIVREKTVCPVCIQS